MPEAYIALTPVHWFYLVGVLVILFTMILRKDTPLVCIAFPFWDRRCWKMQSGRGNTDYLQFHYLCHQ